MMQFLRRPLNGLINRNQLAPHAPIRMPVFNNWYRRLRPMFSITRHVDRPMRQTLRRQIEMLVGDRYDEGNRALQALTSHDLASFGYRVAPEVALRWSDGRETGTSAPVVPLTNRAMG